MGQVGYFPARRWRKFAKLIQKMRLFPVMRYLQRQPTGKHGQVRFLGKRFEYVDGCSLAVMYRELFIDGVNDFCNDDPSPYVLDCGANIGVSVLRYKHLFPKAQIVTFEPDKELCGILRRNLQANNAGDVEVVEAAVWTQDTTITFASDLVEAGHICTDGEGKDNAVEVKAVRLADYLNRKVDFLKLDIEGAELEVLRDCADRLGWVDKAVIEVHHLIDRPDVLAEILTILHGAGYKVSVGSAKGGLSLTKPYQQPPAHYRFHQWLILYAWR
jgi:FkbM family methyltransferase